MNKNLSESLFNSTILTMVCDSIWVILFGSFTESGHHHHAPLLLCIFGMAMHWSFRITVRLTRVIVQNYSAGCNDKPLIWDLSNYRRTRTEQTLIKRITICQTYLLLCRHMTHSFAYRTPLFLARPIQLVVYVVDSRHCVALWFIWHAIRAIYIYPSWTNLANKS